MSVWARPRCTFCLRPITDNEVNPYERVCDICAKKADDLFKVSPVRFPNEVIAEMETYFKGQFEDIRMLFKEFQSKYTAQLMDDITGMAVIVNKHRPDYPYGQFYSNCGWHGTIPMHDNSKSTT